MSDSAKPSNHTVQSEGDRIVAEINGERVADDWQTMKRLAEDILREADNHKSELQKVEEISGAWVRISCDCCDYEEEYEYVRDLRDRRDTPEEHVEHPDFDCTLQDVTIEAFCPRHGTIPMAYDGCDECASTRQLMNR